MNTACVILAAGRGRRMKSELPKVLHKICGLPMLQNVIDTAKKIKPQKIVVVAGQNIELIKKSVEAEDVLFALQNEPKGTADALKSALNYLGKFNGILLVLNGDTPLISKPTISKFLALHKKNGNNISVLSFNADRPQGYGRIIRDRANKILSIIEERDADAIQKKVSEVNSGVYAINSSALEFIDDIKLNTRKGEYYLTDIVAQALKAGLKVSAYCIGAEDEFMGVNTKQELQQASKMMRINIINAFIQKGVEFLDPDSVFIHPYSSVGTGSTIYPNVFIEGRSEIGKSVAIYPNVRIVDSIISDGVEIKDSTLIEGSVIREGASVGPFAHIRPGSYVGQDAKIGNFVELKKATIGKSTKASHLSYLGDVRIGKGVNIGAGTITCNFDGKKKHTTIIEDNVFVGSDSQLVAPVRIGKGSYIGAGSTITKDVPESALAVSRAGQKNIKDWVGKEKIESSNKREK